MAHIHLTPSIAQPTNRTSRRNLFPFATTGRFIRTVAFLILTLPRLAPAVITCLALALTHPLRAATPTLTQRAEQVAAELPWYTPNDAVNNRTPTWGPTPNKLFDAVARLQPHPIPAGPLVTIFGRAPAFTPRWTPDDIRPLLKNKNPKVRTLGLMLLFDLARADAFPDIALLLNDNAVTFPTPADLSNEADPWPMEVTTVANYAYVMMQKVCYNTELFYDTDLRTIKPEQLAAQLRAWAKTRNPELCLPALAIAFGRATGSTTPLPNDRRAHLAAFREKLDLAPMPLRFFAAIHLQATNYPADFDAYLLALAAELPRATRLATVACDPPDDPDLPRGTGAKFLLEHAPDLFLPKDADLLLSLAPGIEKKAVNHNNSAPLRPYHYAIAAAQLRPAEADDILLPLLAAESTPTDTSHFPENFQTRTDIAVALARHGSDRALPALVDWFYNEPPAPTDFGQQQFLDHLQTQDPARYRTVIARLIQDPRLDTLTPAPTADLLHSIQGYLGRPLLTELDYSNTQISAPQPEKKSLLPQWHQTLRTTLKEWSE